MSESVSGVPEDEAKFNIEVHPRSLINLARRYLLGDMTMWEYFVQEHRLRVEMGVSTPQRISPANFPEDQGSKGIMKYTRDYLGGKITLEEYLEYDWHLSHHFIDSNGLYPNYPRPHINKK